MFEKIKTWAVKEYRETLKNFGIKPKEKPTMMTEQKGTYEISLVPEVKRNMIKAMKFRNILLFCCIVLMAVSGGIVMVMVTVWEGQNITMSGQDSRMKLMADKLTNYGSLSEFLTIQKQLKQINEIIDDKKVLSRVFPVLSVILPEGPDTISLSELTVNLDENTLIFDAQADAKVSPYIDYRVLESFKKSVSLMKYDYGRYVTADGDEIPSRCMVEADAEGNTLIEEDKVNGVTNKYIYAYWMKGKTGCDPAREDYVSEEEEEEAEESGQSQQQSTKSDEEIQADFDKKLNELDDYGKSLLYQQIEGGVTTENADVVKIYRSPRFSEWYKAGYMTEGGAISDVNHFESECITYTGAEASGTMKWVSDNNCMLSAEDPSIRDSSNGRDSNGNLVLRFSATLTLEPAIFEFKNKHVMAISPSGQNVTDSYRQVAGMFAERAADCSDSDVICTTTSTDSGGEE
ncbi:hypothetical protein IJI69_02660 [Candidatus Saccharibacteria bacterium]|nr:hypothetical protein [Candidatus Saccharibacteria bacterium]